MTRTSLNKKEKELVPWPSFAWLALTNRCNLECNHCQRKLLKKQGLIEPREMSWKVFNKLESEVFPHLEKIQLGGNNYGEQLMASEWERFFERLKEHTLGISIISNGTLFNKERIKAMVEVGVEFNFSLEGTNEASYEATRGWKFKRFLWVVREACQEKRNNPSTGVRVNLGFTASRGNICELPGLLELASHLGIDRVTVTHFIPWQENQREQSLVYHKELANEMLEQANLMAKELNLVVDLPKQFGEEKAQTIGDYPKDGWGANKPCYHPWRSFSVNERGEVMPCCATSAVMGDLERSSFSDIWNGPKYQRLRRTVNSPHPLPFCKNCGFRGIDNRSPRPLSFCSDEDILLAAIGNDGRIKSFSLMLRWIKDGLWRTGWGRKLLPHLVTFYRRYGALIGMDVYGDWLFSLTSRSKGLLRLRKTSKR
jgi:radical SAM protein with 4Fe4S-binding SPASM domain